MPPVVVNSFSSCDVGVAVIREAISMVKSMIIERDRIQFCEDTINTVDIWSVVNDRIRVSYLLLLVSVFRSMKRLSSLTILGIVSP